MPNGRGDPLAAVMRDGRLRPAAKLVYRWLWRQCGGGAGELYVRLRPIAEDLSLDARTVRRSLEELNQTGRVCVKPRPMKSLWHVYVAAATNQTAEWPAGPVDGIQRRLPFAARSEDGPLTKPADEQVDGNQTPDILAGQICSNSVGHFCGQDCELAAQPETGQRVRPPPDDPPEGQKCAKTAKLSDSLFGTKENKNLSYQSTKEQHGPKASLVPKKKQEQDSETGAETRVGLAVAEAIGTFTERTSGPAQKRRLVDEIRTRAGRDPKGKPLAAWVCGAAADLFLLYDVPVQELDRIWTDMEAMRNTEQGLYNPPGFFQFKIRALAEQRVGSFPPRHEPDP